MSEKKRKLDIAELRYLPENLTDEQVSARFYAPRTAAEETSEPAVFPAYLQKIIKQLVDAIRLPLEWPSAFKNNDMKQHRGAVLFGLPGTGKSQIAKAIHEECSRTKERPISFFDCAGPDLLQGNPSQNIEHLFKAALSLAPSVVWIDELDGLVCDRGTNSDIVMAMQIQMDSLKSRGNVFVLGATNNFNDIAKALLRPSRFDLKIELKLPSRADRVEWLGIMTRKWNTAAVDLRKLAERCADYSPADLRALCREAALSALKRTNPTLIKLAKDWDFSGADESVVLIQEDMDGAMEIVKASCHM